MWDRTGHAESWGGLQAREQVCKARRQGHRATGQGRERCAGWGEGRALGPMGPSRQERGPGAQCVRALLGEPREGFKLQKHVSSESAGRVLWSPRHPAELGNGLWGRLWREDREEERGAITQHPRQHLPPKPPSAQTPTHRRREGQQSPGSGAGGLVSQARRLTWTRRRFWGRTSSWPAARARRRRGCRTGC